MAKQSNQHGSSEAPSTFASSLLKIGTQFPLASVFDDFLTLSIGGFTQNPATGFSRYHDEYTQVFKRYKHSGLSFEFSNAIVALVKEMKARDYDERGNDVMGEFFEEHIVKDENKEFFLPYQVCKAIASIGTGKDNQFSHESSARQGILDPFCGSGRLLLAAHSLRGKNIRCYGMDDNLLFVKMSALNLFLNAAWDSEVAWVYTDSDTQYKIGYRVQYSPLGIFKIENREQSKLWQLYSSMFK